MNTLFRTLFSVSLLLGGYYLGTLTGKAQTNAPLCATVLENSMELEISAIYAVSSNQNILGMTTAEDLVEMQKDPRLHFHVCPK